jgi:predicted nucleotidyltransferase
MGSSMIGDVHDMARRAPDVALALAEMSARLKGRRRAAAALIDRAIGFAASDPDVIAMALVGSYARGMPRLASDVDLVFLTGDVEALLTPGRFEPLLGERERLVRARTWGPLHERRFRLRSGLHVELGIVPASWASVDPVDPGTAGVVRGGLLTAHDPDGRLAALRDAVDASRPGDVL